MGNSQTPNNTPRPSPSLLSREPQAKKPTRPTRPRPTPSPREPTKGGKARARYVLHTVDFPLLLYLQGGCGLLRRAPLQARGLLYNGPGEDHSENWRTTVKDKTDQKRRRAPQGAPHPPSNPIQQNLEVLCRNSTCTKYPSRGIEQLTGIATSSSSTSYPIAARLQK